MKKLTVTLVAAVWMTGAGAQGISRMREELAGADFVSRARVEVRIADDAAAAVRSADRDSERTSVMAYGVSLIRDNSQNARGNAQAVEAQFAELFPGIPVKMSYESPWFKVTAGGYFVNRIDAVALCGKALAQFSKAFVVQQEVSLTEIIAKEREVSAAIESKDGESKQ